MVQLKIKLNPKAVEEAERTIERYANRSPVAAESFVHEFDVAIQEILAFPDAWPAYRENCRRRVLSRFPFSIVYRIEKDILEVVAVIHDRKRPGYWEDR